MAINFHIPPHCLRIASLLLCFCIQWASHHLWSTQRLFLVAGQSNAVGVGDSTLSPVPPPGTAWEFHGPSSSLIPLKDPVGYLTPEEPFQGAVWGSGWPAFAQEWNRLTGDTVIIVQAALGGTACHPNADVGGGNWGAEGDLFNCAVAKVKKAEESTGLKLSAILWLQGESDAIGIHSGLINASEYQWAFDDLIQRFRNELGCTIPLGIIHTGRFTPEYDDVFQQVIDVQKLVADHPGNFIAHADAWEFVGSGWMTDPIHFDQRGLNEIGMESAVQTLNYLSNPDSLLDSLDCTPPLTEPLSITLFPVPAGNRLNVMLRGTSCAFRPYIVVDAAGKRVKSGQLSPASGIYSPFGGLVVSDLNAGIYHIRVDLPEGLYSARFLIQRQ